MNQRTIIMKGNKRLSISEQLQNNKDLERLQALRYIDDDFMTVCLEDNFEAVELILRIILNQDDIIIKSIKTQDPLKNLQGRSAVLDVHASDSTGRKFDIEIQRANKGAGSKRARYNSSLLDAHILKPGDSTDNMPDSYVIFITENDVMHGNQPLYHIDRYVVMEGEKKLFGDGSHIIYVNGAYRGNDAIGRLMHDFSCTNPNDMNYKELAKKARYFKEEKEGVASMSQILEDMRNEVAKETAKATAKETAERMIKIGKMSLDEIATYVPTLSIDELKELEEQVTRV